MAKPRARAPTPTSPCQSKLPDRRGHYAVGRRGPPALYGAWRGRFVTGPLTPFPADLLAAGADFTKTAERHGVSSAVLTESQASTFGSGYLLKDGRSRLGAPASGLASDASSRRLVS